MGRVKILKASAGSGKTYKLAYGYVKNVITQPHSYRNILAVTFTNKATTEMKSRILDEIENICNNNGFLDSFVEELTDTQFGESLSQTQLRAKIVENAKIAQRNILQDYSNFSVMTIDKFFQKIFRAFCKELGIDNSFNIGLNNGYFLSLAIDRIIDNYQQDEKLSKLINTIIDNRLEDGKAYNFKKDLLKIANNVFSREFDKNLYVEHTEQIESFFDYNIEFKKEITNTLKQKASGLLRVIDALSLQQSDFFQSQKGLYPYLIKMSKGNFIQYNSYIVRMLDIDSKWSSAKGNADNHKHELHPLLVDLVEYWDTHKSDLYTIEAVLTYHSEFLLLVFIAKELDLVCSNNNTLLLSSSVKLITSLINSNDTPYIYEKIGNRYDILMIDEFQDTSSDQWSNFVPLVHNSISLFDDEVTSVTLVGDVKQSIYMWRGGDWKIFEYEVANSISRDVIDPEMLDTNWRSYANIINFNNLFIRSLVDIINQENNSEISNLQFNENISDSFFERYNDIYSTIYKGLEQKISPKAIGTGGYVEVYNYEEKGLNLDKCLGIIEDSQQRGFQPRDIVILVKNKKTIQVITNFITTYKNSANAKDGVSYEIMSKDGLLLKNSPIVLFIIACYSLTVNLSDTVSAAMVNNIAIGELNPDLSDEIIEIIQQLPKVSINESFEIIYNKFNLVERKDDIAYIQAIHDKIIEFADGAYSDILQFLELWKTEGQAWGIQLPAQQNAIRIETIHAVKGLEFDVVIVPYCDWGLKGRPQAFWAESIKPEYSPFGKIITNKSKNLTNSYFAENYVENNILESIESFNILYVALTRATKELYLMVRTSAKTNLRKYIDTSFVVRDQEVVVLADTANILVGKTDNDTYTFGEKVFSDNPESPIEYISNYPSFDYKNRLMIRTSSEKYFEESDEIDIRKLGILKHKVLEKIITIDDILPTLAVMEQQGVISADISRELHRNLLDNMQNSVIAKYFEEGWIVRNENSILFHDGESMKAYRPDRVVICDKTAVVIDYKFGKEQKSYIKQIENYKRLLREIGYANVLGYLWYIEKDKVVEV